MSTTPRELRYRGWWISHEPWNAPPGEPWVYVSEAYDGPGDTRHGSAKTIWEAIEAIDWEINVEGVDSEALAEAVS